MTTNMLHILLGSYDNPCLLSSAQNRAAQAARDTLIADMLLMERSPIVMTFGRREAATELFNELRASFARGEMMPTRREQ